MAVAIAYTYNVTTSSNDSTDPNITVGYAIDNYDNTASETNYSDSYTGTYSVTATARSQPGAVAKQKTDWKFLRYIASNRPELQSLERSKYYNKKIRVPIRRGRDRQWAAINFKKL